MGSPLAPGLSNLFMGHHEKLWLEKFQTPRYYEQMSSKTKQNLNIAAEVEKSIFLSFRPQKAFRYI